MLTRIGNKVTVGRPLCNVLRIGRPLEGGGSFLRDWTVYGKSEVVGSSVLGVGDVYPWNQLVENGDFSEGATGWALVKGATIQDGIISFIPTSIYSGPSHPITVAAESHAYLISADLYQESTEYKAYVKGSLGGNNIVIQHGGIGWMNVAKIYTERNAATGSSIGFGSTASSGWGVIKAREFQVFDLTEIFGAGNEPSTVDEFKAWLVSVGKMKSAEDDIPYFPYDTGSTFASLPIVASNRNLWDEVWETGALATTPAGATFDQLKTVDAGCYRTKNLIPVEGGSILYITSPISANIRILCFNENGEFTYSTLKYNSTFTIPSNTAYIAFYQRNNGGVYPGGICINISDALDGTYTPHQSQRFPLVISSPLHGIGDVRDIMRYSDHGITRKYGVVDLGTLTWSYFAYYGIWRTSSNVVPNIKPNPNSNMICSRYAFVQNAYNGNTDKAIGCYYQSTGIAICDSDLEGKTPAEVKAALDGVMLVYELATPTFEPVTLPKLPAYRDGTVLYTDTQVHGDTIAGEAPVGFSLLPPVTMTPPTGDADTNGQTDDTATE